ncbi:hypothetical protein [Phenylobacterium sp.]|uniref:hypothetical protein n=1 Tax=Phenylobacterium sp. TaxID=1871053 RepID=UPI002731080B|nr:hypothetical protein [Phenylobacterium sp.]MDP1617296.1 hypothetical protein [Phenylobacterium sp.]MDP1989218.1 hypothetical protein [Phenylobacterium sp.]
MKPDRETYRPPWLLWAVAALAILVGGLSLYREVTGQNDGSDLRADPRLAPVHQAQLLEVARTAYALLRTPEFAAVLKAAADDQPVYVSRDRGERSAEAVLADLTGRGRYLPVRLVMMDPYAPGARGHYAAGGGVGYVSQDGEIHLPPDVLADWASGDLVRQSCALNTLAHEIAHTISISPFVFTPAFTDTRIGERAIPRRDGGDSPVASYLIGSAAQCAWLQQQGRIVASEVRACVNVFGTRGFNDRCRAFTADEPIRERPGLPPPMRPL